MHHKAADECVFLMVTRWDEINVALLGITISSAKDKANPQLYFVILEHDLLQQIIVFYTLTIKQSISLIMIFEV